MTDEQLLTEYLGERYHLVMVSDGTGLSSCSCGITGIMARMECPKKNRTFQTPQDFHDLVARMVELGDWDSFSLFALKQWWDIDGEGGYPTPSPKEVRKDFTLWLILNPDNCQLVADWRREKDK